MNYDTRLPNYRVHLTIRSMKRKRNHSRGTKAGEDCRLIKKCLIVPDKIALEGTLY